MGCPENIHIRVGVSSLLVRRCFWTLHSSSPFTEDDEHGEPKECKHRRVQRGPQSQKIMSNLLFQKISIFPPLPPLPPPPCYRRIGAEGIRFSLAMVGGGRGVCKTKKFEETYEAQLEYFHRGGGGGRRYWIFSSTTQQEIIKLK